MADRSHLSIGEVLSLLQDDFPDVTISKIRFLESQGLLDPERTPSGYRKFYEGDIERLRWILRHQRDHFLPLKVIKDRLEESAARGLVVPPDEPLPEAVVPVPAPAAATAEASGPVAPTPPAPAPGGGGEPADAFTPIPAPGLRDRTRGRAGAPPAPVDSPVEAAVAAAPVQEAPPAAAPAPEAPPAAPTPAPARALAGDRPTTALERPALAAAPPVPAPDPVPTPPPAPAARPAARPAPSMPPLPVPSASGGGPLDPGVSGGSFTPEELLAASGLDGAALAELSRFGLIVGRTVGGDTFYDEDALVVARSAAGFVRFGIEARHLRMYKVAAEREAGFMEQVVMPMLKQRNPTARQQAAETLGELARLGDHMRAALLRTALRDSTEPR